MSDSRLSGLRKGFENADALNRMVAHQKKELSLQGRGLSISDPAGRGEVLDHLAAERRLGSMADTIFKSVGGFTTDQELKDAAFLLNRASQWR